MKGTECWSMGGAKIRPRSWQTQLSPECRRQQKPGQASSHNAEGNRKAAILDLALRSTMAMIRTRSGDSHQLLVMSMGQEGEAERQGKEKDRPGQGT